MLEFISVKINTSLKTSKYILKNGQIYGNISSIIFEKSMNYVLN